MTDHTKNHSEIWQWAHRAHVRNWTAAIWLLPKILNNLITVKKRMAFLKLFWRILEQTHFKSSRSDQRVGLLLLFLNSFSSPVGFIHERLTPPNAPIVTATYSEIDTAKNFPSVLQSLIRYSQSNITTCSCTFWNHCHLVHMWQIGRFFAFSLISQFTIADGKVGPEPACWIWVVLSGQDAMLCSQQNNRSPCPLCHL